MPSIFKKQKRKTKKDLIAEQLKVLDKLYVNTGRQSKARSN